MDMEKILGILFIILILFSVKNLIYVDESKIEYIIFEKTNELRESKGIHKLSYDSDLSNIAKLHSEDMIQNNFYSHDNLRGEDPTARANKYGYNTIKDRGSYQMIGIGENIAGIPKSLPPFIIVEGCWIAIYPEAMANCFVESWIESPGHYRNLVSTDYTNLGVGVSCNLFDCKGTQNFF